MRKDLKGKLISLKYRNQKEIIQGILIDFNLDWTLIKTNFDYLFDGYQLLNTDKIIKFKYSDEEQFKEEVLKVKGIFPLVEFPKLKKDIFKFIQEISDKFGAFEIRLKDESILYVGKMIKHSKNLIYINKLNPEAVWEDNGKYNLKKIYRISFDTDYTNSLVLYNIKINNNQ